MDNITATCEELRLAANKLDAAAEREDDPELALHLNDSAEDLRDLSMQRMDMRGYDILVVKAPKHLITPVVMFRTSDPAHLANWEDRWMASHEDEDCDDIHIIVRADAPAMAEVWG